MEVPQMLLQENFGYFVEVGEAGLQVVELPYAGRDVSLLVVLPRAVDGLPQLEAALTVERLAGWQKGLVKRPVAVTLPRFRLETKLDLQEPLAALGMKRAPSVGAELSRLTSSEDLFLSAASHQALVEVDEEGTEEAAAGRMIVFGLDDSEPGPRVDFTADHPFLFLIRHNATGAVVFAGRLVEPS